jgi:hypothetical protein
MFSAQARQQLLHLLHCPISSRILQAHLSARASFLSKLHNVQPCVTSQKFPCTSSSQQAPAAAEACWSSGDSSSSDQQGAPTNSSNSSAMADAAATKADGYDNQWVNHWKQGVAPGQVRA